MCAEGVPKRDLNPVPLTSERSQCFNHCTTLLRFPLFCLFVFFSRQILENVVSAMPRANHFEVYVPKFTVRTHKGLKEPLQALGLKSMFEMSANFTGMARVSEGKGLLVTDVQHEAMIEVRDYFEISCSL